MTNPNSNPTPVGSARAPALAAVRHPAAWLAVVLVLGTFTLYWPAIHLPFINYDDPLYVTANPRVLAGLSWDNMVWAFTSGHADNWHPVTWLSLMLDASLFGPSPAGFHVTSVLLHAVNSALLFWLLLRLTGTLWRSAMVAALFAWHPLHVESVAWVTERKDVLSGGLGFLALLFYVYYVQSRSESPTPASRSRWYYGLSLLAFTLGLLAKPMLVTWPAVLLLLDYWPLGRLQPGRWKSLVVEKIPFFALAVGDSLVTYLVQHKEGAVAAWVKLPFGLRCENALISYVRYLGKTFWPRNLAVFYPHPGVWPFATVMVSALVLAGVTAALWTQRRRRPFLLMGWLWFVGTLVPVIGVVQVGQQAMADRYMYIPSVGVFILLVWGAAALTRGRRWPGLFLAFAGATSLVLCVVFTRQQLGYWHNSETLFRHSLAVTENNYIARNNLGDALLAAGQATAAIPEYQETVRLQPDNAIAHFNLGVAFLKTSQTDAAIREFQNVLQLQPDYAPAHYALGNALLNAGQTNAAISEFQAHLRLEPDDYDAHFNLGYLCLKQGQYASAAAQFQAATGLQPDSASAHYNLGVALNMLGQPATAISEFQTAIRLNPDYALAHDHLGIALAGQGRLDEAISEFQAALRIKPDYASAQNNLARALALKSPPPGPATAPAKP